MMIVGRVAIERGNKGAMQTRRLPAVLVVAIAYESS
jgi:hypothetical protein